MVKLASEIWRDFEVDGDPQTDPHQPIKVDIREWGKAQEDGISVASASNFISFGGVAGALDANRSINDAALVKYTTDIGRIGGTLLFPFQADGEYWFNDDVVTDFTGIVLKLERGVRLRGAFYFGDDAIQVDGHGQLFVDFLDGLSVLHRYPVDISDKFLQPAYMKERWLTEGDLDRTRAETLTPDGGLFVARTVPFAGSDTISVDAGATLGPDDVTWNLTNDGNWRLAVAPMLGGQEMNFVFPVAGTYNRGVFLRGTLGYAVIYIDAVGPGQLQYRIFGNSNVGPSALDYIGYVDHLSYQGANVMWTIRKTDDKTHSVLINGQDILLENFDTSFIGEIERAGPAVHATTTVNGVTASYLSKVRRTFAIGKRDIHPMFCGDSKTSKWPGGYVERVCQHLEYSFGAQILDMTNLAVAGDNSGQQLTALTTHGLGAATDVVIAVGTNDVQGASGVAASIANIKAMIDFVQAGFRRVYLVVYEGWWPKTLNFFGQGETTFRYEEGAAYRAAMIKLAAAEGIPFVDMQQCFPPMLGYGTNPAYGARDILARDNLHQSLLGYEIYAWHIARMIAGNVSKKMTPQVSEKDLPTTNYLQNSWTAGTPAPFYSIDAEGRMTVGGQFVAGTKTDGTIFYQLPRHLYPKKARTFSAVSDLNAGVSIILNTTGQFQLFGFSTATVLSLATHPIELAVA